MDRLDIGDILMNKNKEKIFKRMLLNALLVDITEIDLATIENNDYKLYNKNIYIVKIKNRMNVLNTNFNNQKCNRI